MSNEENSAPDQDARQEKSSADEERRKLIPGVVGRSAWFAERTGEHDGAMSIGRLTAALDIAERMPETAATLESGVVEAAESFLSDLENGSKEPRVEKPILIDAEGDSRVLKTAGKMGSGGLSAVHEPLRVPSKGLVVIPVDMEVATRLDLEDVVLAEMSDPADPQLSSTLQYLPQHGVLVGQVDSGVFQAFAFPKDPWLRTAFDTLALHWRWVERDPRLRGMLADNEPGIIDRICQLILCAPDYRHLDDSDFLDGLGTPPGDLSDICERCVGDFLGEIRVVDDIVVRPPLIKWWWHHRRRCSRWVSIGPVPDNTFAGIGRVTQLDVHPSDGRLLIAGAAGGGVWRSDNSGDSWRPLMQLEPTLTIGAVAIAPSDPSVMYAASGEDGGGWNPAWPGVGIYRSADGGANWTLMTSVSSTRFSAIVVHPRNANVIYVAGNRGLHKSVDGGISWRANPGMDSVFDGRVTDVVIGYEPLVVSWLQLMGGAGEEVLADAAPAELHVLPDLRFLWNSERVYIGVRGDGVYRSTTGGESSLGAPPAWQRLDGSNQLPSGSEAGWIKLAIGRRGTNRSWFVVAKMGSQGSRIFSTTDGGNNWAELASNVATVDFDEWCSVIAVDPTDQDIMYAGAAGALKRTTNGGASAGSWTSVNSGIHPDQQDLAFDPNDTSKIYLANDGGVYRSTNRGTTWTLASGHLAITQMYDIDISERDRDVCAGGAQDNGLYYRNVAGVWRNIPWGDGTQIAIDPTDPEIFYFSSQNGLPGNIRKSVDGGATHQQIGQTGLSGGSPWITIIKLEPRDPISDPASNRVLFVCGSNSLFRSADGGQTWQRVEDGSGAPFVTSGSISALEFARSDPRILYLGTSSGALYRGDNGGITAGDWSRIDVAGSVPAGLFPFAQIQAIRVNPFNPNDVWIVFGGSGVSFTARPDAVLNPTGISHVFRNPNATDINSWRDASGQFPSLSLPDVPTSAIALADFDPDVAYVGNDVGAFRTTDGGVTWGDFQDGLPRSPVVELRFHRRHNRLFAGTMGRGVYIRDV